MARIWKFPARKVPPIHLYTYHRGCRYGTHVHTRCTNLVYSLLINAYRDSLSFISILRKKYRSNENSQLTAIPSRLRPYQKLSTAIPICLRLYQVVYCHTKLSTFIPSCLRSYQVVYVHTKLSTAIPSCLRPYQVA